MDKKALVDSFRRLYKQQMPDMITAAQTLSETVEPPTIFIYVDCARQDQVDVSSNIIA